VTRHTSVGNLSRIDLRSHLAARDFAKFIEASRFNRLSDPSVRFRVAFQLCQHFSLKPYLKPPLASSDPCHARALPHQQEESVPPEGCPQFS